MKRKIAEQGGRCGICHEEFTNSNDVVPEWAARGETIRRTISWQYIGGVTKKKAQQEWTGDGRLFIPSRPRI
jgi:hypothetical protein